MATDSHRTLCCRYDGSCISWFFLLTSGILCCCTSLWLSWLRQLARDCSNPVSSFSMCSGSLWPALFLLLKGSPCGNSLQTIVARCDTDEECNLAHHVLSRLQGECKECGEMQHIHLVSTCLTAVPRVHAQQTHQCSAQPPPWCAKTSSALHQSPGVAEEGQNVCHNSYCKPS